MLVLAGPALTEVGRIVLGFARKRTFASVAWFELVSLSILWIFWIAIAGHIASSPINHIDCSLFDHRGLGSLFLRRIRLISPQSRRRSPT
jgi:hypothetical protein